MHPFATILVPKNFLVRLACVKHAASVHSEPGSNSPYQNSRNLEIRNNPSYLFITD